MCDFRHVFIALLTVYFSYNYSYAKIELTFCYCYGIIRYHLVWDIWEAYQEE